MTEEEIVQLSNETKKLVEIFESHKCITSDEFSVDEIKKCIEEMAQACIENKEECQALLTWMEDHEFYTSPASTKFHGDFTSGLCVHSLMVTYQALKLAPSIFSDWAKCKYSSNFSFDAQDIFVAAMSHDFCKAGFYSTRFKNSKDIFGNTKKTPYFIVKSEVRNLGHGNESVLLLLESMPSYLKKRGVLEAISRHMGFSDITDTEKMNYSNFLQNPLVILIQLADQTASGWYDY